MVASTLEETGTKLGLLGPETPLTRAVAAVDWTSTALGPIPQWPPELRALAAFTLGSPYPTAIWWGHEYWLLHNEAFESDVLRDLGPCQGRKLIDIWPEHAVGIAAQFAEVVTQRRGLQWQEQEIVVERDGKRQRTYWNYTYSPIFAADGSVAGILAGAREVTEHVASIKTNSFVVDLDSATIALDNDIGAIIAVTSRLLGERLGVNRVAFVEIDESRTRVIRHPDWRDGTLTVPPNPWPGSFDTEIRGMDSGQCVWVSDTQDQVRVASAEARSYFERIGVRASIVCPVHDGNEAVGGLIVQQTTAREWSGIDLAIVKAAAARLWQAIRRARQEIARDASERRYRLIFEQAEDIIFTADIDQTVTDCNNAGANALGLTREEVIGRSIRDFVSTAGFDQTSEMLRRKIDHGGNTRHEVDVTGADGRSMRWENNSTLIVDRDNQPIGLLSISRDVTERRAFEERQRLLINELNHRVKNTLALVQAIAHQSFRPDADPAEAQHGFIARIGTLASAHDLLTREQWEGVTFAELVRAATAPLGHGRIASSGPLLTITPKAAVALAMALHELGTNAVKYGALTTRDGQIKIDWSVKGQRLHICWREHGGPEVRHPDRRGFGVKMIERALAADLSADVAMSFEREGVRCTIDAPLEGNIV